MRLLLDTNAVLWWLADDPTLAPAARDAVADPDNLVMISGASAWEIGIKRSLGKLRAPDDFERQVEAGGFIPVPITLADGLAAGALPRHHDDPFDRMLVAQAQARGLTIVTRDSSIAAYGVTVLPA